MNAMLQLACDRALLLAAVLIRAIGWLALILSGVFSVVGYGLYLVAAYLARGIARRQGLALSVAFIASVAVPLAWAALASGAFK